MPRPVTLRRAVLALVIGMGTWSGAAWAEGAGVHAARGASPASAAPDSDWQSDVLDWQSLPVDLSFLNAGGPAGSHGFLQVQGDRLAFQDGTPALFWGTNLTAHALFGTTDANACLQAHRLSMLGFNLVRIHHYDSGWLDPNIFGPASAPDTRTLDVRMLGKFDHWIRCLRDEGIYVWLDLHVQRNFTRGDSVDDFEEMAKGKPRADLKGYNYVNDSVREAMQRFNAALVTHVNAETGLAYRDDPAIVAMLLTNENDVTDHYASVFLPRHGAPRHRALYMQQAQSFAEAHGLSPDGMWRFWEYGSPKLFLNDLERRFDVDMIAHLRALGVRVPLVTTSSWGLDPLSSLPALTAGDMVDVHSYGGEGELRRNPLSEANMVDWMAAAQVAGKPLTVTEWNVSPFPVPGRHVVPLYVASAASLQGWRALMQFGYAKEALNDAGIASNWQSYNDPALLSMLPAAALLYRQQHVREAQTTYAFAPSAQVLFGRAISPDNSVALRTAAERGKLVIVMPTTRELPWLRAGAAPAGAKLITDARQPLLEPGATAAASDTGELRRDWSQGTFIIDTARSQAAMGNIGGQAVELADVSLRLRTRLASVAVQSLDGQPIRASGNLLVSFSGRSLPRTATQLPYFSEAVRGSVSIRARSGLRLYGPDREGQWHELPAHYANGRYDVPLQPPLHGFWLRLAEPGAMRRMLRRGAPAQG
jgi:hypothetical protein